MLNLSNYPSYEALKKDFIVAFSKMRLKHDILLQIHGFKQKNDESMRDGASHLRQYLARCPKEKIPSQERLVYIFLEVLKNKDLHATLYMKHHKNLNQCINDAIDYDDNCGDDEKKDGKSSRASSTISFVDSQVE